MKTKQILIALMVAVAAVFLWKNYTPSPATGVSTVHAAPPAPAVAKSQTSQPRAVATAVPPAAPPVPRSTQIIVAPAPSGRIADRLKTGPNAQNNWAPSSGQLKTGPNAQNNWTPDSGQLKKGPNAQTELTMKRSW